MALFNKTISAILPFIPRTFAKPFASRYVAGVTVDEANITLKLACKRQVRSVNFLPF